jgi:hypothetical protein
MNKLFKFYCDDTLVLLPLAQVIKIEFQIGDKDYNEDDSLVLFYQPTDGQLSSYVFNYHEKDTQTIVKAIENFYSNNVLIWELEKELPFC